MMIGLPSALVAYRLYLLLGFIVNPSHLGYRAGLSLHPSAITIQGASITRPSLPRYFRLGKGGGRDGSEATISLSDLLPCNEADEGCAKCCCGGNRAG